MVRRALLVALGLFAALFVVGGAVMISEGRKDAAAGWAMIGAAAVIFAVGRALVNWIFLNF